MASDSAHGSPRRLPHRGPAVKHWSIRWQLVFWCVLALSIVLTAFSASTYLMVRYYLIARIDAELVEESNELAEEVEITKNEQEFRRRFQQRYSDEAIFGFRVGRMNGDKLFGSSNDLELQIPLPVSDTDQDFHSIATLASPKGERWRVLGRVIQASGNPTVIHVMLPIAQVESQMQIMLHTLILNVLVGLTAVVFVGYLIARQVMAPIHDMTVTAESISAENLSERIPVINPHDELGRLATTLNTTFGRLQRSITEMRRFTSNAAHELRTPLQVIRTEAEVTLRRERVHGMVSLEEFRRVAHVTVNESTRLSLLVDQLLMLSRQDAGVDLVQNEPVSVKAVLLDVVEALRDHSETKGLSLVAGPTSEATVRGDDVLLSQVFSNLIENAIKYTPLGGSIVVSCAADRTHVRIAVKDTGIGIDPKHHDYLFHRFYRVDASRHSEGTGLGLAICKSIVQSHGGEIRVESAIGQGATFTVTFPLFVTLNQHNASEVS